MRHTITAEDIGDFVTESMIAGHSGNGTRKRLMVKVMPAQNVVWYSVETREKTHAFQFIKEAIEKYNSLP